MTLIQIHDDEKSAKYLAWMKNIRIMNYKNVTFTSTCWLSLS